MDLAIELKDVTVMREGRPIVADLSLTLDQRRVALVGPNGSGKSTLLRLCNGLVLPDHGRVTVNGIDTRRDADRIRSIVRFGFQSPEHQLIMPTVEEDVALGLPPGPSAAQRLAAVLREFRLETVRTDLCSTLSGGQKQLAALAGIVASGPHLLLLDEVTTMLDLVNRMTMIRLLLGLPQMLVLATHDFGLAEACDRVVYLSAGRIVADGAPQQVLARYRDDVRAELRAGAPA